MRVHDVGLCGLLEITDALQCGEIELAPTKEAMCCDGSSRSGGFEIIVWPRQIFEECDLASVSPVLKSL